VLSIQVIEPTIFLWPLGAHRRRRVAGFGGAVTQLGRPVPFIRDPDQFRQPLGATLQLRAQPLVRVLALGRQLMAGIGSALPLLGSRLTGIGGTSRSETSASRASAKA
jgi:hypothetical protein